MALKGLLFTIWVLGGLGYDPTVITCGHPIGSLLQAHLRMIFLIIEAFTLGIEFFFAGLTGCTGRGSLLVSFL